MDKNIYLQKIRDMIDQTLKSYRVTVAEKLSSYGELLKGEIFKTTPLLFPENPSLNEKIILGILRDIYSLYILLYAEIRGSLLCKEIIRRMPDPEDTTYYQGMIEEIMHCEGAIGDFANDKVSYSDLLVSIIDLVEIDTDALNEAEFNLRTDQKHANIIQLKYRKRQYDHLVNACHLIQKIIEKTVSLDMALDILALEEE